MDIFKSIIPIIIYFVISLGISIKIDKTFSKTLPFIFIISVFITFLSQILFKTFNIGLILIILAFIYSLLIIIKNHKEVINKIDLGVIIFFCLCIIFIFIDFSRHYFWDDEVGFWGKMVKEMFRLDRFYCLDESTLRAHNDYPPFMSLFEYIWCKFTLGYSEANCSFSLHIFEFSLFVPALFEDLFKDKKLIEKIIYSLLLSLSMVGVVVYLDASDIFNTIYVDITIGMQMAYSFYLIYTKQTDKVFGIICFILSLCMMIMTKQVALSFYLLIVFYYVLSNIKRFKNKETLICLILAILCPLLCYVGWSKYIEPYNIIKQFDFSKISIQGFLDIFRNNGYQYETIRLYINALLKKSIYTTPISITFVSSLFIELLLIVILIKYTKNKNELINVSLMCIVGTLGYALLMLILYVFCYPEIEALALTCYERYMSSFISAIILCIVIIFIYELKERINNTNIRIIAIVMLIIIGVFNSNKLIDFIPQVILGNRMAKFEDLAIRVDNKIEEGSELFVVYDHNQPDGYAANMQYFSETTHYMRKNMDLSGLDYNEEELKDIYEKLKQYDYIFVHESSELFDKNFSILNNNEKFEDLTIYKVLVKNNEVKLEKFAKI